jgi:hypothetical protein
MQRYTTKNPDGSVSIADADMPAALQLLAAFEDAYADFTASQELIPQELARLKAEGKEKTVRYKELFGQKLINLQIASLFERHGIGEHNHG